MYICGEELKLKVLQRLKVCKLYGSTLLTVFKPKEEQRWKAGKLMALSLWILNKFLVRCNSAAFTPFTLLK